MPRSRCAPVVTSRRWHPGPVDSAPSPPGRLVRRRCENRRVVCRCQKVPRRERRKQFARWRLAGLVRAERLCSRRGASIRPGLGLCAPPAASEASICPRRFARANRFCRLGRASGRRHAANPGRLVAGQACRVGVKAYNAKIPAETAYGNANSVTLYGALAGNGKPVTSIHFVNNGKK